VIFPSRGGTLRRRLWLAETTARMFEVATRTGDALQILRYWAREIAAGPERDAVALYLKEGERWIRVLSEDSGPEVPAVADTDLTAALGRREPLVSEPVRRQDPHVVLAAFAAREGWRGVVALWSFRTGALRRRIAWSAELAMAISRSLTSLKRTEIIRDEALASERSRWAAELHDGFLQSLISAKLHAEVCLTLDVEHEHVCLAVGSGSSRRLREELERTRERLELSVQEVRRFLLELRSPPGTAEEFLPWLHEYAEDFARENGTRVDVRVEGEGELSKTMAAEAIRLVREALTNVRKHARASTVRVAVAFAEHGTTISISDDGAGFDVTRTLDRLLESPHNGLIGIRYRTESVGGVMRVRSEPGRGTTLLFRLPRTRPEGVERRKRAELAAVPRRAETGVVGEDALTVQDSIRSTLADVITSFLEQDESVSRTGREKEER
jgi:signal transduction histidine kinase